MPIFDVFRINHKHLGRVNSIRTEHNIDLKKLPEGIGKTIPAKQMPFEHWKKYITTKANQSTFTTQTKHIFD